jgi:hypothetical protein
VSSEFDSALICPADDDLVWREHPANRGWDRAEIVRLLAPGFVPDPQGGYLVWWGRCEIVDGNALSEEQRQELYQAALIAQPRNEAKGIFWDGPGRPLHLGTQIPALVQYQGDELVAMYPRDLRDVGIITIRDYLTTGDMTPSGDPSDPWVYDPDYHPDHVRPRKRGRSRH